ncbi:MAG TPA: extracellular solute-binding protein [Chloroflexota bacterium]|nr:extracellular solute-binding protein [Chloroflexota bacterium]HEX2513168.1 extracellular solute-binding protein [Chloroflexota bacterium]
MALSTTAGALGACGPQGDAGGPAAPRAAPARVSLFSRVAEQEAFTERAAALMQAQPQIELEYTPLPGDYPQVIRTHAAGGTLADVLYLQNLVFEGLAAAGDLQPIDALIKRDKVDLKQWWEAGVKAFAFEGKQLGLPARGQIQHCWLYFNRDAFQRAGLREPAETWSLDDLVTAADRLTVRGSGQFGYGTMWSNFQRAVAATRRFGGELLSADGKKSLLDSPQALRAMQWHWELWHRREVAQPKSSGPADFGQGTVAMLGQMLAGQRGEVRNQVKDAFQWSMVLMPKGPTGAIGADTSLAPVTLHSKARAVDAAWQVLQWFTNKETGIALALQKTGSNTPGMRRDVYCDERVLSDPLYPREMLDRVCKAMEAHGGSVQYVVPANFRQAEVDQVAKTHLDAFMSNDATPNPATMRAFHTELQAVLDRPRS